MKPYNHLNKTKEPLNGLPIHLEDLPTIVDTTPSAMMKANGGMYTKRDKIHLDTNSGDSHNTPAMPKDVFQLERLGRGLGRRLMSIATNTATPTSTPPVETKTE